jgi:hypothetical protein
VEACPRRSCDSTQTLGLDSGSGRDDSRCLLKVCSPSQIIKFDQHASRTLGIKPDVMFLPILRCGEYAKCLLRVVFSWIVVRADVFKPKRPNRGPCVMYSLDFAPVEMGRIARQNDDAPCRIRLQLFRIELLSQADVENTRDYSTDSVLRVSVRHQLNAVGHSLIV